MTKGTMEKKAIDILEAHRTMAIATIRPDGWPQTTIVGFANDGLLVYFLVSRNSQKFHNIRNDDRVSIAVGSEPADIHDIKAVYAGARASEVTDPAQRADAWRRLVERHPNLKDYRLPDPSEAALMRAACQYVSILDYSRGLGHSDSLTVGAGIALMDPARTDDWGLSAVKRKLSDGKAKAE